MRLYFHLPTMTLCQWLWTRFFQTFVIKIKTYWVYCSFYSANFEIFLWWLSSTQTIFSLLQEHLATANICYWESVFSRQTAGSLCWTYAAIFRDKQVNNLSNLLNRLDSHISSTLTLNTGVPQGCVLSPLLLALFTYACTPVHGSDTLLIFQCGELQRVVKTAQRITSASLPSIDAVQRKRFLQKECSHPNHWLFILYI